MESQSNVSVTVANNRNKFLFLSITGIFTMMAITTAGILVYDKIQNQTLPSTARPPPSGQTIASLASNGTRGSVTTDTTTIGLVMQSTTSGVRTTYISTAMPASTITEQTTTETEVTSSSVTVQRTYDVTTSTPIGSPTEITTTEEASTCQPILSNNTAPAVYPTDCSSFHIEIGYNALYTIFPYGHGRINTMVSCVSTCDGLWTVIQRRFDGSVDFYRGWMDYKEGFGDASGEYWLGNDAIYQLTSRSSYKLKVVLKNTDNVTAYAIYGTFQVSNESDGYRLTVGGYHGDAGDSLTQHNRRQFSTLDRDNDDNILLSCAERFTGAWWFYNCLHSDLNGPYLASNSWATFSSELPLKETTMMIQRILALKT